MSVTADQLRDLMALGLEGEKLLAVVTVMSRDTSRSPGAVRAARYRQNRKIKQVSAKANDVAEHVTEWRDVSRDGVTARCDLTVLSSLTESQQGIQEVKKGKGIEQVEGRKSSRGTRITEDWQPREEDREFVRGLGLDPVGLREEFVDFWIAVPGSRGLKLDWFKTYKNRAREIAGRNKGRLNGHAPRPGSKDDTRERTVNALRTLDPFPYTDDAERSEGASPPLSRQLSFAKSARS